MTTSHLTAWKEKLPDLFLEAVFFICYYLYIGLRVEPALVYQRQNPVFLTGFGFMKEFLSYPGGLTEYASAFLSQAYYHSLRGALILTGAAWAVAGLTRAWIRSIHPGKPAIRFFHLVPAVLLLVFHSQYTHPLSVTLALILSLLAFLVQIRFSRTAWLSSASFVLLACILYYTAAGALLLFALLCALREAFAPKSLEVASGMKRPVLGAFFLAVAAVLPLAFQKFLFMLSTEQAYLQCSLFQKTSSRPVPAAVLLYGFYFLYFAAVRLRPVRLPAFAAKPFQKMKWLPFALRTLAVFALAATASLLSFKKGSHAFLRVEFLARHERWDDLLKYSAKERSDLLPVAFQTNRALFHTGRLLEDMFSYPQNHGTAGLMLPRAYRYSAPLQESDFCWDLGSINESRHWAYEAVSTDGETPWILKRMATVNFVSGDFRAAGRCLNLLDKTLFFEGWVEKFRGYLADTSLAAGDESVRHGRSMLTPDDFIVVNDHPPFELDTLLAIHPGNRMAFEYRVAHELLSRKLGGLHTRLAVLNRFGYQAIPRHMAEALLGLWAVSGRRGRPAVFQHIRPETLQRFRDFNQALGTYREDKAAAEAILRERFGDTYWYYMLYGGAGRSAAQASKVGGIE
jgi:hypothetical protein